jgi:GAF domain-containing protein
MDKMNQKPNFKTMTSQELKSYVLSHREDDEAFYAYVDKVNERKDRVVYPPLNSLEDLEKYPEVREVILKGSIVYIKDITQNPLTKDIKKQLKDIDMTSLLVFPVRHRQETLGTLAIRLGKDGMAISDKHLKTFYMIALCIAPKVAARKLLKKIE